MSQSTWPVPDRDVTVAGRTRPLEIVVVSGLYAVAALWLAFELRGSVGYYADVIAGLFSGDELEFLFMWIGVVFISLLWYLVLAFAFVAVKVFQVDPLGRGLSAVVSGLMAASTFTSQPPWSLWVVLLISILCTTSLYVSPWSRRAFAASPWRHGRPEPVVVSEAVAVSYYSLLGLLAVLLLPGIRFIGDLGTQYVLFEALVLSASVSVWVARGRLRSEVESDRATGRLLVTITSGFVLVSYLVLARGNGAALGFAVFSVAVGPLWLAPSARTFFGDTPLSRGTPPGA